MKQCFCAIEYIYIISNYFQYIQVIYLIEKGSGHNAGYFCNLRIKFVIYKKEIAPQTRHRHVDDLSTENLDIKNK